MTTQPPQPTTSVPVTVVLLTYNEERNLEECLESLSWADEVIIVDSGSTDKTLDIAARRATAVVQHPFETHARQWSWALANLPCRHTWILGLDADQRVTPQLAAEIRALLGGDDPRLVCYQGFYIRRRQIFRGRWIRYGGYYPKYLLKLFRRDRVFTDCKDLVDHHFYVRGAVGKLRNDLIEDNRNEDDISFWIAKHDCYATRLAEEHWRRRTAPSGNVVTARWFGTPDERTLWKKQVWARLPLFVRPVLYFFYRYIVLLGFLDGRQGFVFHVFHGFWFRLLVDVKLDELQRRSSLASRSPTEVIGSDDGGRRPDW